MPNQNNCTKDCKYDYRLRCCVLHARQRKALLHLYQVTLHPSEDFISLSKMLIKFGILLEYDNGEPAVLVHYVALIGNHGIVQITHCRWRCSSLHQVVCSHEITLKKKLLTNDGDSNMPDVFFRLMP